MKKKTKSTEAVPDNPKGRLRNLLRLWTRRPLVAFFRLAMLLLLFAGIVLAVFYQTKRQELSVIFTYWVKRQTHHLFTTPVTFSAIETTSLGHFIFYDFKIEDPFDQKRNFLDASRVEVRFDPLQLLWRGSITLSRLEIHRGKFWIHRELGQGRLNHSKIFKGRGKPGGPGIRVRIRSFLLDNCHVLLEDVEDKPIENEVRYMEGRYTRIAGENVIELLGSSLNTSYWSVDSVKLTGIITYFNKVLGFRKTRTLKGKTDLTGDGFVDFTNRTFEYKIRPRTLELSHLPPELKMHDYLTGTVNISVQFSGRFDSTWVSAQIELPQGEVFSYRHNNFSTRLQYTKGRLIFDRLETESCGGEIKNCSLAFDFSPEKRGYTIRADVNRINIPQLHIPHTDNLDGSLSGHFELEGSGYSMEDLSLAGRAVSIRGELKEFKIDSSQVSFTYRDSNVRIDNLAIYSGPALATAIGDIDHGQLFLFLLLENLPVAKVDKYLPLDSLQGTADLSGTLSGNFLDPQLKGTFSVRNGSYKGLDFETLEGACSLNRPLEDMQGSVEVSLHDLEFGGQRFESLALATTIADNSTVWFSPLLLVKDSLAFLRASGSFKSGSESGESQLLVDSLELSYRGERAVALEKINMNYLGDTLAISGMELATLGGKLSGDMIFVDGSWLDADFKFQDIDLSRLPEIFQKDFNLGGILKGRLNLRGNLSDPGGMLEAQVDSAALAILTVQNLKAKARLSEGRLHIDNLELTTEGSTSVLTGEVPLALVKSPGDESFLSNQTIRLEAQLNRFPVNSLRSNLIPLSAGTIDGKILISGSAREPVLKGEVVLAGGKGVITPINMRLDNMTGRVFLKPGYIQLYDFRSTSPEGIIGISGRIVLKGFRPDSLNLNITGRDLVLQQFRYVTSLRLDADLIASGAVSKPVLQGNVQVVEGELNPMIGSVRASDQQLAAQSEVRLPLSPIDYDLNFIAIEDFWLRNRNANIKLTANLRAVQRDSVPQVSGQITTVVGYYSLFGRRFRIRYGNIQFQGRAALNPLLDINAERTVRGKILRADLAGSTAGFRGTSGPTIPGEQYEVDRNTFYLHIGGIFNSPQFDITVRDREDRETEPPLTEEQSRTLVIFDQTYREFQQQSSLSRSKLLDQAANLALSQANPYLQELTGFDEFSFESQLFDRGVDQNQNSDRASARITMGEFLFESIFFSLSQDLIDPGARSAQIEYLINRNSSIISQTDSRGHFSIDYRYRIKY